jgi:Mg-chelatase subunit ChlI
LGRRALLRRTWFATFGVIGLAACTPTSPVYIDEVNLLPDHLVDLLLDVAASGVNSVEREGISVRHPARFLLVGTMNPEEGDLRPQFVDRFGVSVTVTAPGDEAERMEVVRRRMAFDADCVAFVQRWSEAEASLAARVRVARQRVAGVEMPEALLALAVRICLEANVDGLRPDLTIYRAACALAAFDGRSRVFEDDIYRSPIDAARIRWIRRQVARRRPVWNRSSRGTKPRTPTRRSRQMTI